MTKKSNKIINISVIVLIVGLFVVGYIFTSNKITNSSPSEVVGEEVFALLEDLENVSLDGAIMSDPVVRSLVDFSREIPQEQVGRSNPFAPIGVNSFVDSEDISLEE
jgi:hypothetical protein